MKDWLKYARGEGGYTYYRGFALKSSATGVSSKHFCSANYSGSLTPSIIINYTGVPIQDLGEISAWGKHIVCDASYYSFVVPETGTYSLSTTITNGPGEDASKTEITVLNLNYNQIAYNQEGLNINCLSRIETQLSAGKYFVYVSDYNNNVDERVCYFIIEKSGELQDLTYVAYKKNIYEFKKISDADGGTNCLAYALNRTGWLSTAGFTRSNLVSKMHNYGYSYTSQAVENCVVAYYNANVTDISEITHFARIDNGIVTSKLGGLEVVQHPSYDAYFPNVIDGYGMAYAFFIKNSNL